MPADTSLRPSRKSQEGLVKFGKNCLAFLNNNFNLREQLRQRDLQYQRETDQSVENRMAELRNAAGNAKPLRNVTIPVVAPQVEAALTYYTELFLTGYPIFPVVSQPNMAPAALQMETLVGDQSLRFGWAAQLLLALRDGLKYNLMGVEVDWTTSKVWAIHTDDSPAAAAKTTETYYQGNQIRHLDMYNTILDTRVQPSRMHIDGEFAGYTELMGRIKLKQLFANLDVTSTMNARDAFEKHGASYSVGTFGTDNYYIPDINPWAHKSTQLTQVNWHAWAGLENKQGIRYDNLYEVTTLYARLMPSEFELNVKEQNTPQIFKLIIVNRNVLIYFQRMTNAHNYLPIVIGQPSDDGLGWQTKSFAENSAPFQAAASALFNSGLESQRRKVYDRLLYDPSMVNKRDIDNVDSVARIPVKQSAYGTNISQSVYQIPYRDDGVDAILAFSNQIVEMANVANGQNRVTQGQFQKGNKSRREFETVVGNANGRQQMGGILLEHQFFMPIKEIIKLNILQYQPPTTLTNLNTTQKVRIDPTTIRAAGLDFQISDGVLPVEKLMSLDEGLNGILQMTMGNPQAMAEWDIMGMMMYSLQMKGASWVQQFRRSPAQQQSVLANAQATAGATDAAGNPLPTQPNTSAA